LVATRQQISKIKNEVEKNIGPEEALIFDAHLMVLEDQALIGETIREFEAPAATSRPASTRSRALHPGVFRDRRRVPARARR
jgi:phosphoenolpyruvate-protein kinase (PTS system EI component)